VGGSGHRFGVFRGVTELPLISFTPVTVCRNP